MATDFRSVGEEHADVVQQRRLMAARCPAISLALPATRTLWRKRMRWALVPAG
jgi:hypothetical protein